MSETAAGDPVRRSTGVILAGGRSDRFGGLKLLAQVAGKPLLQHAIDAATGSGLDDVVVVLGHAADRIAAGVQLGRARPVTNVDHAAGQSTSLKAGLRAAAETGADGVVVLLGDQPRITSRLIDALLERAQRTGASVVISSWKGRRSAPTYLGRATWPEIARLSGDVGARDVIATRPDVETLEVTDELGSLIDIDRPEDLSVD